MKNFIRHFHFLGQRNYIHGSSLINNLIDLSASKEWPLGQIDKINATFNYQLKNQARYELYDFSGNTDSSLKKFPAFFDLKTEKGKYILVVNPQKGQITERMKYDEEGLVAGYVIEEESNTCFLDIVNTLDFVNVIIALNKQILFKIFPKSASRNWFLARCIINYQKMSNIGRGVLKLKLSGVIGGISIRSDAFLNNESVAKIYFLREKV